MAEHPTVDAERGTVRFDAVPNAPGHEVRVEIVGPLSERRFSLHEFSASQAGSPMVPGRHHIEMPLDRLPRWIAACQAALDHARVVGLVK